jgi:hypothetical protein
MACIYAQVSIKGLLQPVVWLKPWDKRECAIQQNPRTSASTRLTHSFNRGTNGSLLPKQTLEPLQVPV